MDPKNQEFLLPDSAILFRHVQENCDLYRVLLFSDRTLIKPVKRFAIREFRANYTSLPDTDIPFDIIVNHMVSALITLLRWWLENDMRHSPEEMGEYASGLIFQPTRDLLLRGLAE